MTARAHSIAKEKIQTFGGGGGICCGAEVGKNRPFFYMVMEKGVVDVPVSYTHLTLPTSGRV